MNTKACCLAPKGVFSSLNIFFRKTGNKFVGSGRDGESEFSQFC